MRSSFESKINKIAMVIAILLKRNIAKMKKTKILKVRKRFTAKLIQSNRIQVSLIKTQLKKMGTIWINFRALWWLRTNRWTRTPKEYKNKTLNKKVMLRSYLIYSTHKTVLYLNKRILNSVEVIVKVKKMMMKKICVKHKRWMVLPKPQQKIWITQLHCRYWSLLHKASHLWYRQQCKNDS